MAFDVSFHLLAFLVENEEKLAARLFELRPILRENCSFKRRVRTADLIRRDEFLPPKSFENLLIPSVERHTIEREWLNIARLLNAVVLAIHRDRDWQMVRVCIGPPL